MFTQAQIEYIQKQFARGLNKDAIRNKLLDTGWEISDIEDGFREYERITPKTDTQISAEMNAAPQVVSPEPVGTPEIPAPLNPQPVDVDKPKASFELPSQAQPQVQPQVEVVKTMPIIATQSPAKSNGGKIFFIIFAIIIVLLAGAFAFYKFIYLPKMGTVNNNSATTTVETLPVTGNVSTTTEEVLELPSAETATSSESETPLEQANTPEASQSSEGENVDNTIQSESM